MTEHLSAQIIEFPSRQETAGVNGSVSARVIVDSEGPAGRSGSNMPIARLYPLGTETNPQLASATRLLKEAVERLSEALSCFERDDPIGADDYAQGVRVLIPELFCCRSLGDGFGSVVLAAFYSLAHLDGAPINQAQVSALLRGLTKVSNEPFIRFEVALQVHSWLEAVGLNPDSRGFDELGEVLGGDTRSAAESEFGGRAGSAER